MTLEVASNLPEALRACTWKKSALATEILVSKPLLGFVETGFIRLALDPLRTCQNDTVVAPFQLAYTFTAGRACLTSGQGVPGTHAGGDGAVFATICGD
jgi:hypothetical protein